MPLTEEKKKAWDNVHKAYSKEVVEALPRKFVVKRPVRMAEVNPPKKFVVRLPTAPMPSVEPVKKFVVKRPKKYAVSEMAIEGWLEDLVKKDLVEYGAVKDLGKEADDYVQNLMDVGDYNEILDEVLQSYGYNEVATAVFDHFIKNGDSPSAIVAAMKDLQDIGYSIFDEIIESGGTNPTLQKYLSSYEGPYQSYVDSDDNEVIYPTDVIVELIKLAYKGTSPEEIAKKLGYSLKEIKTMIYDNFENRNL